MSTNFGKSFDGLYGSNLTFPSFKNVAIKTNGYNPSFDVTQNPITKPQGNQLNHQSNQYSLSQRYQSQSNDNLNQEQGPEATPQMNSGDESEALQIGYDPNLESQIDSSDVGLSVEEVLKLQAFRLTPKINFAKVLRF